MARFPIRFDRPYALLSRSLLLRPADSYIETDDVNVQVRMGWAFRARFARQAVATVTEFGRKPLSRGVHGWAGRWLVNGSGDGILDIELRPPQRAFVLGFPVRLRHLLVSVEEPVAVAGALRGQT
jgi:hypothetical protein